MHRVEPTLKLAWLSRGSMMRTDPPRFIGQPVRPACAKSGVSQASSSRNSARKPSCSKCRSLVRTSATPPSASSASKCNRPSCTPCPDEHGRVPDPQGKMLCSAAQHELQDSGSVQRHSGPPDPGGWVWHRQRTSDTHPALVRSDNPVWRKRTAKVHGFGMRRIFNTGQGRPVKRVGENSFHGVLLGTPYT